MSRALPVNLTGPRYPRTVIEPPTRPVGGLLVMKSARNNRKLSGGTPRGRFTKGRWIGFPLYSLTLAERTTCPASCELWRDCYGNGMPFAKRHAVGPALLEAITADVSTLATRYAAGYVIRLHVLGDFPSVSYVRHWRGLVRTVSALHIFGYTHRRPSDPIGRAVVSLVRAYPARVAILQSDPVTAGRGPLPFAYTLARGVTEAVPGSVICPEQTGRTASCMTCGLCMNGRTSVSFIRH